MNGSKSLADEITLPELMKVCLSENDRRLAPNNPRLLRPALVPSLVRLAVLIVNQIRAYW